MAELFCFWREKYNNQLSNGQLVKDRIISEDEFKQILEDPFLKNFKFELDRTPYQTHHGEYVDQTLMAKISKKWFGVEGASPVIQRIRLHLDMILGYIPRQELPELVITPIPKVDKPVYSKDPGKFVFEFSDENDNLLTYEFDFLDKTDKVRKMSVEQPSYYMDFWSQMESYGVHDFVTSGDEEIIGFSSYEVDPIKYLEVVNKWHNFFSKKGYALGPIKVRLSDE